MTYKSFDYWQECVAQSLEEHGVAATQEQIEAIAHDVESGHDNYGQAFHQPSGPSPDRIEADRLAKELADERSKVPCRQCNGTGREVSFGPAHGSDFECIKCRGEGRHLP